jgi:hypothetical protein
VARTSGVGVRVAASGVGVAVGVAPPSWPSWKTKNSQPTPIKTKNATSRLVVNTSAVRFLGDEAAGPENDMTF